MRPPFPCYDGDEPYAFVSYAHADAELVYPELLRLHELGINVWFDEGISPGSFWRAELAQAIADCGIFVYFVTPRSVESEICVKEVSYAQTRRRPILVIHLEETELPIHLEFALGDIQAIMQYRLTEPEYARKLSGALNLEAPVLETPATPTIDRASWKPLAIGITVTIVGALAGLAAWEMMTTPSEATKVAADTATLPDETIVMVLPFDNLSSSEDDRYFTMGVYDDVLARVSRLPDLKVTGRASAIRFRNSDRSLADIASEVGASHILTGSVRHLGDDVRISVELISMQDQTQLWAEIFERPVADVFDIQRDIASGVAGALDIGGVKTEAERDKANVEAYNLFAEAREIISSTESGDIGHALELLQRVIELNPEFAEAYSLMVVGLHRGAMLQQYGGAARQAAERALELAPDSHESHFAMALTSSDQEARTHFDRALELNPNDSRIRFQYGNVLANQGRMDEAWGQWNQAIKLDPLSAATHMAMVNALPAMGRWEEAMSHLDRALELEPDNPYVLSEVAGAMERNAMPVEAMRYYLELFEMNPEATQPIEAIARKMIGLRQYETAEHWIDRLPADSSLVYVLKAELLRNRGEFEACYRLTRKWLEAYPDDTGARLNLAFAIGQIAREAYVAERYVESERQRLRAAQILEEILASSFEDGHYRWQNRIKWPLTALMVLYKSLGEEEKAAGIANDILPYQGVAHDWSGVQFHRGVAFAVLGREDEAVAAFQQLVDQPYSFVSGEVFSHLGLIDDPFRVFKLQDNVAFLDAVDGIRAREERTVRQIQAEFPDYF